MMARRHNRFVVGAMLLAALACYCDVPRMHLLGRMGDTLNVVRVLDVASHIQFAARAALDADTAEDLEDGRRSMELVASTPVLIAALPAIPSYFPPLLAPDDTRDGMNLLASPVAALPGMLLVLDLPPPRSRPDVFKPGLNPALRPFAGTARAPPLL